MARRKGNNMAQDNVSEMVDELDREDMNQDHQPSEGHTEEVEEQSPAEGDTSNQDQPDDNQTQDQEPTMETQAEASGVTEFAIETDVPPPGAARGVVQRQSKYPWDKLPLNASFFVPGAKLGTMNTLCSTQTKKTKDLGPEFQRRFIARKAKDAKGVDGIRVWRVEPKASTEAAADEEEAA